MSDAVIISLIAASGLIAIRLGRLHQQLNSRMDQLLGSEKAMSRAEGVIEGLRKIKPDSPTAQS